MTAYSATPLAKKLGIKPGTVLCPVNAPPDYLDLIAPLPDDVRVVAHITADTDLAHIFSSRKDHMDGTLRACLGRLHPKAAIWVSWPKKTSRVPTHITEDTIQEVALPVGLVDVKLCAVNEIWSGLKLVIRRENRPGGGR